VERFHGLCNQFFWSRHRFANAAEVAQHYPDFLQAFREEYASSRLADQTPAQARQTVPDGRVRTLPENLVWIPGRSLPLVDGRVHCIRLTDSQGRLSVLGRHFCLEPCYRRAYIRATLTVAEQQVSFYYQEAATDKPELVTTKPFPLSDAVEPWNESWVLRHLTRDYSEC
jgi:hypothetical protein